MKKAKLLLILFTCGLLAACGKKEKTDIPSSELNYVGVAKERPTAAQGDYTQTELEEMAAIPGVQILKEQTDFSYAYTELKDGSLLFTIEGTWNENQKWDIVSLEESVVNVNTVSQSKEKVEYQFAAKNESAGYSEFNMILSEKETGKDLYTIIFSMISNSDNQVKPLNAFGYVHSDEEIDGTEDTMINEETAAEEITEERYSEEELNYQKEMENGYNSITGERTFPEEFVITGKGYSDIQGTKVAVIAFTYKGHSMYCSIAPSLTIDDLKQAVDNSDSWKTKKVGETEVVYYTDNMDTTMMWMDEEPCCYSLYGRGIVDSVFSDVIQLMMSN